MAEIIKLNLQGGIPTITEKGTYQLVANEVNVNNSVIINVDTSKTAGNVDIVLPYSFIFPDGQSPIIYIIDIGANAEKNSINVYTDAYIDLSKKPLDFINGGNNITISNNRGVAKISCIVFGVWMALGNVNNK